MTDSPEMQFEVDVPSGEPREPFLLLTHGAGGDLSSSGLTAFSSRLAEQGHLSVRVNLPYRSAGRKSPPAAERAVDGFLQILDMVKEKFGPSARWIAGGRSYGGRVASMAAIAGLDAAGLAFFPYPLHRPGDPSNPRAAHWPRIKLPCLFVQGTHDPFCDMSLIEKLLPTLGAEPTLIPVPGGDHSLKVRATNSPSARSLSEDEVVQEIMPAVVTWLRRL